MSSFDDAISSLDLTKIISEFDQTPLNKLAKTENYAALRPLIETLRNQFTRCTQLHNQLKAESGALDALLNTQTEILQTEQATPLPPHSASVVASKEDVESKLKLLRRKLLVANLKILEMSSRNTTKPAE